MECESNAHICGRELWDGLTSVVHVEDVAGVGTRGHPADERSNTVVLHGWDISEAGGCWDWDSEV